MFLSLAFATSSKRKAIGLSNEFNNGLDLPQNNDSLYALNVGGRFEDKIILAQSKSLTRIAIFVSTRN